MKRKVYSYKSKKTGVVYYIHTTGRIPYFSSKNQGALSQIPRGWKFGGEFDNGLPYLRKK